MINNIDREGKNSCSSCGGCKIICPMDAIEFSISSEGFFNPTVDYNKCINCGLCMKGCYKYYSIDKDDAGDISRCKYYAAWSIDNEIRFNSSSGGVTHEILIWGIKNGYKVIGCTYNNIKNHAQHIIIDNIEDLNKIQGSKYLQSNFSEIKGQIDYNHKHIVVGTPCQIYTIKKIVEVKGKIENFIFIDFFCHGAPSYNLWKSYKEYIKEKGINNIETIDFRCKQKSWHDFSMYMKDGINTYNSEINKDPFLKIFLSNACLNEPCFSCKFRFNKLSSDFRVGDFWGQEYKDDTKGVSLVLINSQKANLIFHGISEKIEFESKEFASIKKSQYVGEKLHEPEFKDELNRMIENGVTLELVMNRYFNDSIIGKVKRKIIRIIKKGKE